MCVNAKYYISTMALVLTCEKKLIRLDYVDTFNFI